MLHGLGIVIDMPICHVCRPCLAATALPQATSNQSLFGDYHSPVDAQRMLSWYLRFVPHLTCDTGGSKSRLAKPGRFVSCRSVRFGRGLRDIQTLARCRIGALVVHGRGNGARLPNLALAIRNGIDPSTASKET